MSFKTVLKIAVSMMTLLLFSVLLIACDDDNVVTDEEFEIIINELMSRNVSTITDSSDEYDDWIELYNPSDKEIDIGGFSITDDIEAPTKWVISTAYPSLTTIPAYGYLIIWADGDPEQGILHTNFNLSGSGENVAIYNPDGAIVDVVYFGPQLPDVSYGRLPNGSDTWSFLDPATPGEGNTTEAHNFPPEISDVEHSPIIPLANDDIVITAEVSDEFGVSAVNLLYSINSGEYQAVQMEAGSNFKYTYTIPAQAAETRVTYYLTAEDTDGAVSQDPEFAPTSVYSFTVMSVASDISLYINEFLASNEYTNTDNTGEADDWIEIYNAGSEAVDLGGMYITDNLSEPYFYQIPYGYSSQTTVPAGGYLLLWADGDLGQGPLHVNFSLSANGESIGLFSQETSGGQVIDAVNFGEQDTDVSYGRSPDGSDNWTFFDIPTPMGSNH